jgi:hypothetical protein
MSEHKHLHKEKKEDETHQFLVLACSVVRVDDEQVYQFVSEEVVLLQGKGLQLNGVSVPEVATRADAQQVAWLK